MTLPATQEVSNQLEKTNTPETTPTDIPTKASSTAEELPLDATLNGNWEGEIRVSGTVIGIEVVFSTASGMFEGILDIPSQNLNEYELREESFEGKNIYFEGFRESGRVATFDGQLNEDDSILGVFTQVGIEGEFELHRSKEKLYREEEISFENENLSFAGTLSFPEGEGPFPAVVLITGSGPQTRDEDIFGFKIFSQIADALNSGGIAVLRYDDRGMGGSQGNLSESNSEELAGDTLAAVRFLQEREDILIEKIGLLGHSEGGIIAPMISSQSDEIAFIVLMAGPAITGEEIILLQVELLAEAAGVSQEKIKENLELQQRIFNALKTDEGWDEIEPLLKEQFRAEIEALPEEQQNQIDNIEDYVNTIYTSQISSLQTPWFEYFLSYDPVPTLEKIDVPVLAIFGELDLQVPPEQNAIIMKTALENAPSTDIQVITLPKANHLFQEAISGSVDEYAQLDKEFIDGFLELILDWISQRVFE
ncbi:MAG: alpha/beta fold hydrolase [Anaerolineaceae bacterium]|nr:alpha/beta fold hydrolase [Anaerolineaceae bacterium]